MRRPAAGARSWLPRRCRLGRRTTAARPDDRDRRAPRVRVRVDPRPDVVIVVDGAGDARRARRCGGPRVAGPERYTPTGDDRTGSRVTRTIAGNEHDRDDELRRQIGDADSGQAELPHQPPGGSEQQDQSHGLDRRDPADLALHPRQAEVQRRHGFCDDTEGEQAKKCRAVVGVGLARRATAPGPERRAARRPRAGRAAPSGARPLSHDAAARTGPWRPPRSGRPRD